MGCTTEPLGRIERHHYTLTERSWCGPCHKVKELKQLVTIQAPNVNSQKIVHSLFLRSQIFTFCSDIFQHVCTGWRKDLVQLKNSLNWETCFQNQISYPTSHVWQDCHRFDEEFASRHREYVLAKFVLWCCRKTLHWESMVKAKHSLLLVIIYLPPL